MSQTRKKPAAAVTKRPAAGNAEAPAAKRLKGNVFEGLHAYVVNLERRPDRWKRVSTVLKKETPWLKFERFLASDGTQKPIPKSAISETWNTECNAHYGDYFMWVIDAPRTKDHGKMWRFACETPEPGDKEWRFKEHAKQEFEYIRDAPFVNSSPARTATAEHVPTGKKTKLKLMLKKEGDTMKMSGGERGCAHSHHRLWGIAASRSSNTLVLEDDVHIKFERNGGKGKMNGSVFTKRLELALNEAPADFDVIYLGWSGWRGGHLYHWPESCTDPKTSHILQKSEYVWTTVAYVISPKGAKKLLKAARPMNQPVDNFMAWEASQGRLNSYVVLDEGDDNSTWAGGIVDQFDFQGDSDIKKSDGGVQGDDAKEFAI